MKTFINLSSKESKDVHFSIYKNALQLKSDAMLLAKNKASYSSATSLLVLSTEEVIKSILVCLHSENYNVYKLKEAGKFFKDHKIRHQIIQLIEMGSGLFESAMKYHDRIPAKFLKTKLSWFDDLINGAIDIISSAKPFLEATNRIERLEGFNEMKNNGFYVNYRDGLILPQETITKEIYEETLLIADRVFRFSKMVRILFNNQIENHLSKNEIDEIKQKLRFFIDDALGDFSFNK
ncbi:AbiV family abortive infection protein [Flavobacteriaceae bacterium SZ-1-7]|uniref:AbiV family abortive infection protein n=1 Tax=Tamlana sedimenti TaxID=3134126 RepID=UPI0031235ACD